MSTPFIPSTQPCCCHLCAARLGHCLPAKQATDTRLKKATSRMGTTIMQKTGQVERTVDREFAEEEGRYRT